MNYYAVPFDGRSKLKEDENDTVGAHWVAVHARDRAQAVRYFSNKYPTRGVLILSYKQIRANLKEATQ